MEHKGLFLLLPDFIMSQNKMLIHTFVQGKSWVMWWVFGCQDEKWVEVRSRRPFLSHLNTGPTQEKMK